MAEEQDKKLCDMCGEWFVGFPYHVVDENYNVQPGLIQCNKCLGGNLEENLKERNMTEKSNYCDCEAKGLLEYKLMVDVDGVIKNENKI